MPGAGKSCQEELRGIAQKSVHAVSMLRNELQWIQTFVTADKVYCILQSPNEELILEHARLCGFPVNLICKISSEIDPQTAE
jgi:hypothetical protein